ncbi:hypothetical protein ACGFYY_36100 [Streptomyces sp. NPDC048331]|uniref:hypothetical protein n=1 Tax=Streptomyces sp. NPDC048331 TaxID=3365534 RepID=UPI003723AB34
MQRTATATAVQTHSPAFTSGWSPAEAETATTAGRARSYTSFSPHGWENIWDLPPEDEQRAIKVLFELLDAFLAEREAAVNTQASA